MDRYAKAAAERSALILRINRNKTERVIRRVMAGDPDMDEVLAAMGLIEPDSNVRRCPHCGVVLPEASSRCTRTTCRMKIAALNEVNRNAPTPEWLEKLERGEGDD